MDLARHSRWSPRLGPARLTMRDELDTAGPDEPADPHGVEFTAETGAAAAEQDAA
jgi:hypothetical protein